MKILHIVRQFYPCIGGVENFVYCLVQEQIRAGNTAEVLTLNRSFKDGSFLPENETYNDIAIRRIPFFGSKRYPVALSCIKYLGDYDIIHIHCVDFFVDYLVFLKLFHKKKIILHTHGGFFHTNFLKVFKHFYFNTITRMSLSGCDKIIAVSKHDYELFSKISSSVVQIDNGVDIKKYDNIEKNIEFGSLVYIGRIDEHKRIDNLIKVTALLIEQGYKVNLKIIGPDWRGLTPRLQGLAGQLGVLNNIFFLGQVSDEDLISELSTAHIFVSASEYESFGISAVEAMASGTTCVLNNIRSFKEFLDGQKCGILTNYSDCKESAKNIARILNMDSNTYNTMSHNAKKKASQYSWDKVAKEIMKVYEGVLSH